jgi:hypothetical protein
MTRRGLVLGIVILISLMILRRWNYEKWKTAMITSGVASVETVLADQPTFTWSVIKWEDRGCRFECATEVRG